MEDECFILNLVKYFRYCILKVVYTDFFSPEAALSILIKSSSNSWTYTHFYCTPKKKSDQMMKGEMKIFSFFFVFVKNKGNEPDINKYHIKIKLCTCIIRNKLYYNLWLAEKLNFGCPVRVVWSLGQLRVNTVIRDKPVKVTLLLHSTTDSLLCSYVVYYSISSSMSSDDDVFLKEQG